MLTDDLIHADVMAREVPLAGAIECFEAMSTGASFDQLEPVPVPAAQPKTHQARGAP
jgi:hypothetical protein